MPEDEGQDHGAAWYDSDRTLLDGDDGGDDDDLDIEGWASGHRYDAADTSLLEYEWEYDDDYERLNG